MQISEVGNKPHPHHAIRFSGFTLLELLLVVTVIAIASAGVSLAFRDAGPAKLETEAQRLIAILESARAQSRASGIAVKWRPTADGFVLEGLPVNPKNPPMQKWQESDIVVSSDKPLLLGPEPLIPPQSVLIWLSSQPLYSLRVGTDGVRPFAVQNTDP